MASHALETRRTLADANATLLVTDRIVAMVTLTAPRTLTLPPASLFPPGAKLTILDESGACSPTVVISVSAAGTDTIAGAQSLVLYSPMAWMVLESNASGRWFPVGQSTPPDGSCRNRLINGGFDVWQAGQSYSVAAATTAYTADQWLISNATAATATVASALAPVGFTYSRAITASIVGVAAGSSLALIQRLESQSIYDLDSQFAAVSFDLSASTSAGSLTGVVYFQANTALDNGTWSNTLTGVNFTVPSSVGRISVILPAACTSGIKFGAQICVQLTQTGAAGNVTSTFGAVQLERGPIANPFAAKLLAHEIGDCERYFQTSYDWGAAPGSTGAKTAFNHMLEASYSFGNMVCAFRTRMRATPTITLYSPNSGAAGYLFCLTTGADVPGGVGGLMSQTGFTSWVNNTTINAGYTIKAAWTANARL